MIQLKVYLSSIKSFYIGLGFIYYCSPDLNITFQILNFNISIFKCYDVYEENLYEEIFFF